MTWYCSPKSQLAITDYSKVIVALECSPQHLYDSKLPAPTNHCIVIFGPKWVFNVYGARGHLSTTHSIIIFSFKCLLHLYDQTDIVNYSNIIFDLLDPNAFGICMVLANCFIAKFGNKCLSISIPASGH